MHARSGVKNMQVNISEAKVRLSELVRRAEEGEEVYLMRNNKIVIRLTPASHERLGKRKLFSAQGGVRPPQDQETFDLLNGEVAGPYADDSWPE